jgi:hypothetical protein
MTQQNFSRPISLALAIGALVFFTSIAVAQPGPNSYLSDMKPGSVLFFNKYTSNPNNPDQSDTQINITNTNQNDAADIHLFFVDGSSCSVADSFVSLTENQTASFRMSDFDPGITGYLVAIAVSGGSPTQFNWLIGDLYIREAGDRLANLAAVSVAKISAGDVLPDVEGNAGLIFNGSEYERLPASVAVSSFNSQADANTQVNIYVPSANLTTGGASSTNLFILVYDDTEKVLSTSARVSCYLTLQLSSLRLTGGNINNFVPSGRTGWVRISGSGRPLLGASIQRGAVFTGGHNLHALTLLPTYTIQIPSFGI